jgi:hypothetical protein
MAFALTIVKLEEAMKERGCPVCRLAYEAAIQSIDSFLWENVNDPAARKPINDAYGFCPAHTRMLVAKEMMSSGAMLGVNMIYELLAKNASQDLKRLERGEKARRNTQSLMEKLGFGTDRGQNTAALEPKGRCPVCDLMDQAAKNTLSTLFEELSTQQVTIYETYQLSSGVCLKHLKVGLECFGQQYPHSGDFLIRETIQRLESQQAQMLEYIRKHNWSYRDEQLTQDEHSAWLRTLTFFTGLPPEKFTHQMDEF